jgi:hypothetical protein
MDLTRLPPEVIDEITSIVFGELTPAVHACDLIFIFGGSHPGLWETAARAYFDGLGLKIVVTGGHKPGVKPHPNWTDGDTPEAHVIRRELMRLGVPPGVIFIEDRSTNSLENVLFAKEVYDFSTVKRILVVAKTYGMGRQLRTLRKNIAAGIECIPYGFDAHIAGRGPLITRGNWMEIEEGRCFVLVQLEKIWQYGVSGDIEPILNPSKELEALIQDDNLPSQGLSK